MESEGLKLADLGHLVSTFRCCPRVLGVWPQGKADPWLNCQVGKVSQPPSLLPLFLLPIYTLFLLSDRQGCWMALVLPRPGKVLRSCSAPTGRGLRGLMSHQGSARRDNSMEKIQSPVTGGWTE